MAINRAIISMSVSIRKTLKARVLGEQLTQARKWELSKGLRVKAHRFHVNPQPKKLKDMQDKGDFIKRNRKNKYRDKRGQK
jgi:hypothetical protein